MTISYSSMPLSPVTVLGLLLAVGVFSSVDSACICSSTFNYSILELLPNGTKVGSLLDDLHKQDNPGPLDSFHIIQAEETLPFAVNAQDGVISTKGQLDKEQLCPALDICVLTFIVLYRKGRTVDCLKVQVEVLDANEHGPRFLSATQELHIVENSTLLTRVELEKAVDEDKGLNGLHSYSLSPNEQFALAVTISENGTKQPELVVMTHLDRNVQEMYQLTLFAWDGGDPTRSASILLHIRVIDANDHIPIFERDEITVEINEWTTKGTVIATVTAVDLDEGPSGAVRYTIANQTDPLTAELFEIDPQTGAVRVKGYLDYEVQNSHDLILQAQDMGPDAIPSFCKLHVNLTDVNDNAPSITVKSPYWTYLSNTTEIGSLVFLVTVSDRDMGQNGKITVWLEEGSGPFTLVKLAENEYKLVTNAVLVRGNVHRVNILAQDLGDPPHKSRIDIRVQVTAENKN